MIKAINLLGFAIENNINNKKILFNTNVEIKVRMHSALLCACIANTIAYKNNEWYKNTATQSIHDNFRTLTKNQYTVK